MVMGNRTGIIFNNEMDDFSTPGTNNSFGLPASPSNFTEPGKRPMSSMAPILVLNNEDQVVLTLGSSGGPRITSSNAFVSENSPSKFRRSGKNSVSKQKYWEPCYIRTVVWKSLIELQ